MHNHIIYTSIAFAAAYLAEGMPADVPQTSYNTGANCTIEGTYKCTSKTTFQQCRLGHWSIVGQTDNGQKCDFHDEIGWQASALTYADVNAPTKTDKSGTQVEALERRGPNSIVHDPRVPKDDGKSCPAKKSKRAMAVPGFVVCPNGNGQVYISTEIQRAINYGLMAREYSVGTYPHVYRGEDQVNLHGCNDTEPRLMWEYPLISGLTFGDPRTPIMPGTPDQHWTRYDPGPDRVIFDVCGRLCAVLTHRGMGGSNLFQQCYNG